MSVEWQRIRAILGLSLPTVLVLLAQNLMSLITIAMVGRLGDAAVAGIGIGNALFSMLVAVLFGIDTGVQALVARAIGAGRSRLAGAILNDALSLSVLAGLLLIAVGYVAGPRAFALVNSDLVVARRGMSYLNAVLPMLLFLGAGFAFSAYWNGAGVPKFTLLVAVIQLPCNVLFSYVLIFGMFGLPRLETAGAGLGAMLASLVALTIHLLLALRFVPVPGFMRALPSLSGMRNVLSIGLPVGIQQSLVYLGTGVTFAIIGLLGTREVAAMNVMLAMMLLSILLAVGMGVAAATLVGQALGRDQASDAKRWGWEVACLGAFGIFAFNMVVVVAPRETLGLFITDNATIALAAMPLRILALGTSVDAFGRILGFALRGAGATKLVTAVAFALQWGLQLPLVWYFAVSLGYGLIGLAACRFVLFTLESAIVAFIWRSGFWSQVHRSEQA